MPSDSSFHKRTVVSKLPETNRDYWQRKIGRNIERDQQYTRELASEGWRVIRIWEHEMKSPLSRQEARDCIRYSLSEARSQ